MAKKVDDKVMDSLMAECKTPADVDALYSQLSQRVGILDTHNFNRSRRTLTMDDGMLNA